MMRKVCGIIAISKIEFFSFTGTERAKVALLLGLRKVRSLKKVENLQVGLVLQVAS